MNALLPLGLIAGALILSQSSKKPKASPSISKPKAPYLSADCEWICGDVGFGGLNIAREVFEKTKLYEPLIEKYAKDTKNPKNNEKKIREKNK